MTGPLKFTGIRGLIARRMLDSVQTTAQLSFFADADATAMTDARRWWKDCGRKVGYEDLVIAALARVLPAFALFNPHEVDGAGVPRPEINLGVAIGLPGSLVVPCLFDCAAKTLPEIAAERASAVERAGRDDGDFAESRPPGDHRAAGGRIPDSAGPRAGRGTADTVIRPLGWTP